MNDVILWQSAAARDREAQRLKALAALHQSMTPITELLQSIPRRLRWKKSLKIIVVFDLAILVLGICAAIYLCTLETRFYGETTSEARRWNEKALQHAAQANDPEQKAKAEKSIRDSEEVERKLCILHYALLASICFSMLVGPVGHVCLNWFVHIRPSLLLLREGTPVRASVVQRKRTFLFVPAVEFGFTTDQGEHIRRTQPLARSEARLFSVGDSVWILYLPRRPKLACIYGLKSALARIVTV